MGGVNVRFDPVSLPLKVGDEKHVRIARAAEL